MTAWPLNGLFLLCFILQQFAKYKYNLLFITEQ